MSRGLMGRGVRMRKVLLGGACLMTAMLAWRLVPDRADADDKPTIAAAGAHMQGDAVARGAYLAHMADCAACHTGAGQQLSGGRPFVTPFGTIYAPNITPDKATGVGDYTDDEWVSALRRGVGRGGKHLYPAMPYTNYTLMTRDDALAIKAYLMTQPAVHAETPANQMSFPFNIRFLMVFWNLLNNPDHVFKPDAARDAAWNRGAYLAEALGHCQQCHTPRNIIQGLKSSDAYAGAVQQGWMAYNVTSAKSGVGDWPVKDLAAYLSTGRADGHGVAAGPMAEAVSYSLRFLSPDDATALATYVKSIPAQDSGAHIAIRIGRAGAGRARAAALPGGVRELSPAGWHGGRVTLRGAAGGPERRRSDGAEPAADDAAWGRYRHQRRHDGHAGVLQGLYRYGAGRGGELHDRAALACPGAGFGRPGGQATGHCGGKLKQALLFGKKKQKTFSTAALLA